MPKKEPGGGKGAPTLILLFTEWKIIGLRSQEIGNALQENGILLEIKGREILFYCPKGQFVPWKGKPGLT